MSLFQELKRRNVIRVAIAYIIAAWLLLQIVDILVPLLTLPEWVGRFIFLLLLVGFPIAIIFAWAFELTPEGLKRESEVDREQSIVSNTGRVLDRAIIGILCIALGWFAWDKFVATEATGGSELTVAATTADVQDALSDQSLAVLPFVAMSTGADDEFFADGLTEEILNSLAQLPELLVTARTSAFSFKGQDLPIQEIAAALGVKHVVEGSVRRAGERLRVTAQLIRAHDGFHLWSETYDSESTDAIAVQEDIAEKIALAMDVVLDEEKRAAMRRAGLRDVEAFILYQKGVDLYGQAHGGLEPIGALRQANAYFEQVMQRVPEFGQVYIDHSDLYIHLLNEESWGRVDADVSEEDLASAYELMIRDFELGVEYAATPAERAIAEVDAAFVSGNWRGLSGRIDLALKGAGASCNHGNWLPNVAITAGYAERFRKFINQVVTCDPRWSNAWFNASRAALIAGDKVEALRIAREATEKAPGGWVQMSLVRALAANGEIEEARDIIETQVTSAEFVLIYRTLIAATEGDRQVAEQLAEQRQAEFGPNIFTIILHAWSGNREAANRQAARMAETRFGDVALFLLPSWCQCGAPWDLEATPEFAVKIREANIPWPPPAPVELPLKSW